MNHEASCRDKFLLNLMVSDETLNVLKRHETLMLLKKEGKDQISIQSSTTPDPGYQLEILILPISFVLTPERFL